MLKEKAVTTLQGHQGPINQVNYNVSGEYCCSAGTDKTIILWNPKQGLLIKVYNGHGQSVRDVVSSHDNSHLGSASADRCAFYWDVAEGAILRRFRGHNSVVNCVKFNELSNVLITGGNDSTVQLLDLKSRSYEPIQILDDAKDSITCISVSGVEIVTGSVDGRVRIYDLRQGKLHEDFVGESITDVTFSNDNQSVLVSSTDSTVRLLDKSSGQLLNDYTGHTHSKLQLQSGLWYDDSTVISTCETSKIYLWDLINGKVQQSFELPILSQTLATHPKECELLTGDISGNINVWSTDIVKSKPSNDEETKSMSVWALPPR